MANLAGIIERQQDRQRVASQIPMDQAQKAAGIISTKRGDDLAEAKFEETSAMNQQKMKAATQASIDMRASAWMSFLNGLQENKQAAQAAYENAEDGSTAQAAAMELLKVAKRKRTGFMIYTSSSGKTMNMLRNASQIDASYADRVFNKETLEDAEGEDLDTYVMNMAYFGKAREAQEARKKGGSGSLGSRNKYQESYDAQAGRISAIDDASKAGKVLTTAALRQTKADLGRNQGIDIFMGDFDDVFRKKYDEAAKGHNFNSKESLAEKALSDKMVEDLTTDGATAAWSYNLVEGAINEELFAVNSPYYQFAEALKAVYVDNGAQVNAKTGVAKKRRQSGADLTQIRRLKQRFGIGQEKKTLAPRAVGGSN